jgi:hypothetical protein
MLSVYRGGGYRTLHSRRGGGSDGTRINPSSNIFGTGRLLRGCLCVEQMGISYRQEKTKL